MRVYFRFQVDTQWPYESIRIPRVDFQFWCWTNLIIHSTHIYFMRARKFAHIIQYSYMCVDTVTFLEYVQSVWVLCDEVTKTEYSRLPVSLNSLVILISLLLSFTVQILQTSRVYSHKLASSVLYQVFMFHANAVPKLHEPTTVLSFFGYYFKLKCVCLWENWWMFIKYI